MAVTDDDDTAPTDPQTPPPKIAVDGLGEGARVGDYLVRELIGAGGFGSVFRAEHLVLGRQVALKVLRPEMVMSVEYVIRFEREARAVNMIRHPNVVDIFDFGRMAGGRPYYAMELLDGTDLSTNITLTRRLTAERSLALLEPLVDALTAAHAQGIIHRDVKASNVFLDRSRGAERVVLLDFGIAKLIEPGERDLTTSRQAIGTPASMAPEQLRGRPVDARTDVYALGALLYHMLTGRIVFAEEGLPSMTSQMHLVAARARPSARADVDPRVDEVVVRAMAIDATERYQSARELLDALRAALGSPRATGGALVPALGLYLEAGTSGDDVDETLLADAEGILPRARAALSGSGLTYAFESGNAFLAVTLSDDEPARRALLEAARAIRAALAARPAAAARVTVRVLLHAGRALVSASGRIVGGDLLRAGALIPEGDWPGIFASGAFLKGLDLPGVNPPAEGQLVHFT